MRGPAASIAAAAVVIAAAAYSAHLRRRTAPARHALGSWGVVGSIATIEHTPTAREFWTVDVDAWRPLLLRGAAADMPAAREWDRDTLVSRYGNSTVRTERAKEDRVAGSQRGGMPLTELLRRGAAGEDVYAVSNVAHPMTEVCLPLPPAPPPPRHRHCHHCRCRCPPPLLQSSPPPPHVRSHKILTHTAPPSLPLLFPPPRGPDAATLPPLRLRPLDAREARRPVGRAAADGRLGDAARRVRLVDRQPADCVAGALRPDKYP